MFKKIFLSLVFVCLFFNLGFATTQTVPYDVQGLDWSYGDTSSTEHWMPIYLPIGGMGVRFKIGVRFSGMAIAVKCPLKLQFTYDDAEASGGRNLKIKVKAIPQASTNNTFDSNFGVNLPNVVQLGLINISPLPDILPWYTLSADLWDLLSAVPEVGEPIAGAATNIGVAMSSKEALPDLGDSKEYHDTRTIFSIDLTKLLENNAKKSALIGKVWGWLGPKKDAITLAIQVAKTCNEEVAISTAQDLIGRGLELLAGIAQISFKGDPYFKLKSEKIAVVLDWNIGGRTNGSPVVNLIPTNKEGEITINIPPFVQAGEKIELVPSSVTYEFKLDQRLKFQIAVPVVGDINLGDGTDKTVVYKYLNKNLTASDFKLEIPLSATTLPISEFHATAGCSSATVLWASPNIDLRGTVDVFQGSTKIKSVSESAFNRTHALVIDGLSPSTLYTFHLNCVDRSNVPYPVDDVTATTQKAGSCSAWSQNTSVGGVSISNDSATAGFNSITFNWTTNKLASTELYFSSSPDFGSSYLSAVKKADGSFAVGWADYSSVDRKLETNHSITIPNLQTGTTYHCRLVSWTYKNDKVADGYDVHLTKTLEVTTLSAPSTKVLVRLNNNPVNNITVAVFKTSAPNNKTLYVTGADGYTPVVLLEQGASYQASVTGQACYNDATSGALSVAAGAQGALSNINLDITRKPSPGGYVYDNQNNPISGVTVRMPTVDQSVSVTTDNNGYYTIDRPQFRGEKDVVISKTGYITQTIKGTFDDCGLFSAAPVVLSSGAITLNIHVTAGGNPLNAAALRAISVTSELGRATTDAQGNATITYNRATIPTSTPLSIEVTPPQGSKAIGNTFSGLSYNLGQPTSIDVNCDVNITAPVISNFTLTQVGQNDIWMSFATDKPIVYSFEVKNPDNQTVNVNYPTTYYAFQMVTSMSGISCVGGGTPPAGTYKIRLKVKDAQDNESDTGYVDFVLFKDSSWGFKVKSFTTNSAVLAWNKFPRASEFSKYEIVKAGNVVGTLSDINTTQYTAPGLSPYTSYTYTLRCINKSNASVGSGATLTFLSRSLPPVVSNLTVTPAVAGLDEPVQVSAQISDPDTNIQEVRLYLKNKGVKEKETSVAQQNANSTSVQFSHTFTPKNSGQYDLFLEAKDEGLTGQSSASLTILSSERPRIAFGKIPSECKVARDCVVVIKIQNERNIKGGLSCEVNWGDGFKDTIKSDRGKEAGEAGETKEERTAAQGKGEFVFTHQYMTDGSKVITATASVAAEKTTLVSEPISANVDVTVLAPQCELSVKSRSGVNNQLFHIKFIKGSYPISKWEVYFGDMGYSSQVVLDAAADLTGTDEVDQDVSHTYGFKTGVRIPRTDITRQPYQVKFKVTDTKNNVCVKTLSVPVNQDSSPSGAEGLPTTELNVLRPGGAVAIVKGQGGAQQIQAGAGQQAGEAAQQAAGQAQEEKKEEVPDLSIERLELPREIFVNEKADISVSVKNNSNLQIDNCPVVLEAEDGFKEEKKVSLRPRGAEKLKFSWMPKREGRQKISASLKYEPDSDPSNNKATEMAEVMKKEEPLQLRLRKLTVEGLKAGEVLEPGRPLTLLLEMDSSADFEKPLDVSISLKGKENAQDFKEKIEGLKKGKNSFKWELMKEVKPDKYRLNVEVSNNEIRYKEKSMVEFIVLEEGMEK